MATSARVRRNITVAPRRAVLSLSLSSAGPSDSTQRAQGERRTRGGGRRGGMQWVGGLMGVSRAARLVPGPISEGHPHRLELKLVAAAAVVVVRAAPSSRRAAGGDVQTRSGQQRTRICHANRSLVIVHGARDTGVAGPPSSVSNRAYEIVLGVQ